MIKKKCSNCGFDATFLKAFWASRAFLLRCDQCKAKQFRRHSVSKSLTFLGGSIGLFALLFLYMANGLHVASLSLIGYVFLLLTAYIVELSIFDLAEYTDQEEQQVKGRSKKNVWIAVAVIFLGTIFYVFE